MIPSNIGVLKSPVAAVNCLVLPSVLSVSLHASPKRDPCLPDRARARGSPVVLAALPKTRDSILQAAVELLTDFCVIETLHSVNSDN